MPWTPDVEGTAGGAAYGTKTLYGTGIESGARANVAGIGIGNHRKRYRHTGWNIRWHPFLQCCHPIAHVPS